jgi:hypothetical protein
MASLFLSFGATGLYFLLQTFDLANAMVPNPDKMEKIKQMEREMKQSSEKKDEQEVNSKEEMIERYGIDKIPWEERREKWKEGNVHRNFVNNCLLLIITCL